MKPKTPDFRRQFQAFSLSISFTGALATAPMAFATSGTWDGGAGTNILNTGTNWTGNVLPNASGDIATWDGTVAGDLVLNWNGGFGGPAPEATSYVLASTQTGNVTLDATGNFDLTMNSITIASGAGAFTLGNGVGTVGSSGRIVFRGTTSGSSAQNAAYTNNLFTNNSSNTATWGADLNFGATSGAPRNLVFGGSGNWTVNSNLNGVGIQVTKSGAGTLSLTNAANAAIDIVLIDSGTLKVDGAGTLRSGNYTQTFINNGTFHYNSSAAQSIGSAISGTGALIKGGSSVLTLTGNNSYSGNTTVDAGTLKIGSAGQLGTGTYAGNISIASGAVLEHASSASTTVGGATNRITGSGSITKSGSGTLRINSSQSFSGGVNLTGGILEYDGTGALGTGTITVSAGEITGRGSGGTLANNVVLNSNVQLGRSGVGSGMGFTGNFDMGGGVRAITMNGAPITMSGIISNGGLAKSGTSTLQLSNTGNTYSAGTTLNAGILEYTGAGTLGTGTVTINGGELTARGAGGTLANNFVVTGDFQLGRNAIGSGIGISGTVDLGGGTRTITTPGVNPTISGVISNGGLTKAGSSTLTLAGTNTYTGNTSVNAGTLYISGALGATDVSVAANASIGAGDAIGLLGGDLFFASGSFLDVTLGTLSVANSATVTFGNFGFGNLIGFNVETAGVGTYTLIDGDFTLDPTNLAHFGLANAFTRGDGNLAYFDVGSLTVTIAAVPEPDAALIGSIGLLMLLNRRRRH
jgi:autotransporter-associated beta strand protein